MEQQYYISKEQFTALTAAWRSRKDHTAAEHIIYNVLRGKPAKQGFKQREKHVQGNDPWYAFSCALSEACRMFDYRNMWDQHRDNDKYAESWSRMDAKIKQKRLDNTQLFGFELPGDIVEQLRRE
jgi:hypothetical protein